MNNDVKLSLCDAISIMRTFLDNAERALDDDIQDDLSTIAFVSHQFLWGMANSNSAIETAISRAKFHYEVAGYRRNEVTA